MDWGSLMRMSLKPLSYFVKISIGHAFQSPTRPIAEALKPSSKESERPVDCCTDEFLFSSLAPDSSRR